MERIGADQLFRFFAGGAVHHDECASARPNGRALERAAEHDARGVGVEELDVRGAMRVAQASRVGTIETDDGVHGKVGFSENNYG